MVSSASGEVDLLRRVDVSNICIFVADALRWDHLPDAVDAMGTTSKTVASGLATHTSLPSMVTGLYPPRHGVHSWHGTLPEVPNLLDQAGYECGYYMPGEEGVTNDGTFAVLRRDDRTALQELESPYIYFERHHGTHAPFEAIDWPGDIDDFVAEFSVDLERHAELYAEAAEQSGRDFETRIQTALETVDREDTLFVFTSDHGEYMGEDGLVNHSAPMRPECVYVPTVFVHPDLPDERLDGVTRHVDLYPTVLAALDEQISSHLDGVNLFEERAEVGFSFSRSTVYVRDRPISLYRAAGAWDEAGGVVFNRTPWTKRGAMALAMLVGNDWQSTYLRNHLGQYRGAVRHVLRSRREFGTPAFCREAVREELEQLLDEEALTGEQAAALDAETKEQLRELGYL